jgi:hypothetical protein
MREEVLLLDDEFALADATVEAEDVFGLGMMAGEAKERSEGSFDQPVPLPSLSGSSHKADKTGVPTAMPKLDSSLGALQASGWTQRLEKVGFSLVASAGLGKPID